MFRTDARGMRSAKPPRLRRNCIVRGEAHRPHTLTAGSLTATYFCAFDSSLSCFASSLAKLATAS